MSKWGSVKIIEDLARALGKTTVKEADVATKAFSDKDVDLTKMLKDLRNNPQAMEKLNAMTPEQKTASLQNLAKRYIVDNKKAAAAGIIGAGALGTGQQSEASEGGAAMKAAKALLEKIPTDEAAVALKGADRAEYMKALDTIYGPKTQRAMDTEGQIFTHGSKEENLLKFDLDKASPKSTLGKGAYLGDSPEMREAYEGRGSMNELMIKNRANLRDSDSPLTQADIDIIKKHVDPDVFKYLKNNNDLDIGNSIGRTFRRISTESAPGNFISEKNMQDPLQNIAKEMKISGLHTPGREVAVYDPSLLRKPEAAFDPRFKDSPLLLAGAGAIPTSPDMGAQTWQAAKDVAGTLKQGYNWYKENLQQPVADAITKQTDPSQNVQGYQQSPELKEMGRMAFDPFNVAPGWGQLTQFGLELMPDNKAKGGLVKPQYLNEGEMVLPEAAMDPVMNPGVGVQNLPAPQSAMPLPPGAPPQVPQAGLLDSTIPQPVAEPDYSPSIPMPIQAQQAPTVAPSMPDPYSGMMQTQRNIGELEAGQIKAENEVLNAQAQKMQALTKMAEDNYNNFEVENKGLLDAIKDNKIDPNHYINSQSTGAKVATIFGLLLGGIGQGLAGGENQALKMLNKQIDMDVDAQKANLQNKHNLYTANLQHFRNKQDALMATKLNYMELYKTKLLEAGGAQRSELAKQRAILGAQQLDAQMAPIKAQLAQRQAIIKGAQSGMVNNSEVVMAMAPGHQKEKALAELGKVQDMQSTIDLMDKAMQDIAKLKSIPASVNPQARSQAAALETMILSKGKAAFGNMSEQELQKMMDMMPTYLDNEKTVIMKRKALQGFLAQQASTPTLDGILPQLGITNYKLQLPEPKSNAPIQGMKPRK